MIKKKIALFTLVCVFLVIIVLTILNLNRNIINKNSIQDKDTFTSSFDELKELMDKDASTCTFGDYFKIVQAEYIIIPDKNIIKYSFVFKNITGRNISFNYQIYKEQILIDKYISSIAPALPPNTIPIELPAEKRAVAAMASEFIYPYSSFTKDDVKEIEELASKLYIEFNFDGKFDYFQVDMQKVNQFSQY